MSDHAVVQYLERIGFVDTDAVKCKIYNMVKGPLHSGASSAVVNGAKYCFKDGRVTTVINEHASAPAPKFKKPPQTNE